MEAKKKYYRVDRREISFIKFILEGYDNVALLTTIDRDHGLIKISTAPGCEEVVEMILHDLEKDVMIKEVIDQDDMKKTFEIASVSNHSYSEKTERFK